MAEHMLILKLTTPEGEVKYVTGAFPSACGKTNLAMLIPTLEGWTVETVGDDIAWMKFGDDGRLYAINPEAGFFGVAPGTGDDTNPNAMATIAENTIFTNCALTDDGDVWWEGMTKDKPAHADRLEGQRLDARLRDEGRAPERPLHHARGAGPGDRARVGGPRGRADRRDPVRRSPRDGRAARTEAFDWEHGVFLGATMSSETTAAAAGGRRPAALRPVRDAAVLRLQHGRLLRALARDRQRRGAKLPKIFYVNWFRKDADGSFLWPGFGENSRVLEWVFDRCAGDADAVETPARSRPDGGRPLHDRPRHVRRGPRGRARRRPRRAARCSCRR